jgi:hypothetical protein
MALCFATWWFVGYSKDLWQQHLPRFLEKEKLWKQIEFSLGFLVFEVSS